MLNTVVFEKRLELSLVKPVALSVTLVSGRRMRTAYDVLR